MSVNKINNSLALNRVTSTAKAGGSANGDLNSVDLATPQGFGESETINTSIVASGFGGTKFITTPSGVGDVTSLSMLDNIALGDDVNLSGGLNTSIVSTDPVITASGIFQDINGQYRDSAGELLTTLPAATRTLHRVNNVVPSGDRDAADGTQYKGDFHYKLGGNLLKDFIGDGDSEIQNS